MAEIKIQEFSHRGIVLIIDGKPMQLPFQVIRWPDKHASIRIGDNMLHFHADGRFDGIEGKVEPARPDFDEIRKQYTGMLDSTAKNRALLPRDAYYPENTPGYHVERNADVGTRGDVNEKVYQVAANSEHAVEIREMSVTQKTQAVLDHLPAGSIAHLCEKIFGPGEFPAGLLDSVKSHVEDMIISGAVIRLSTGTLKVNPDFSQELHKTNPPCEQCGQLMVSNASHLIADGQKYVCLNCGARK